MSPRVGLLWEHDDVAAPDYGPLRLTRAEVSLAAEESWTARVDGRRVGKAAAYAATCDDGDSDATVAFLAYDAVGCAIRACHPVPIDSARIVRETIPFDVVLTAWEVVCDV